MPYTLSKWSLSFSFPTRTLYDILFSPRHAKYPFSLSPWSSEYLVMIKKNHEAPQCAVSSSILSLPPSYTQLSPSASCVLPLTLQCGVTSTACHSENATCLGVTSTARHSKNATCRGVTSTARHAALSHSFDYISTTKGKNLIRMWSCPIYWRMFEGVPHQVKFLNKILLHIWKA